MILPILAAAQINRMQMRSRVLLVKAVKTMLKLP
jgi:hypothetical protein